MNYNSEFLESTRRNYKPSRTLILFIGESPPANGTFFYCGNSNLAESTKRAFEEVFGNFRDMKEFLETFKNKGCYLIDLCNFPINHLQKEEREKARIDAIPNLTEIFLSFWPYRPILIVIVMKQIVCHVVKAMEKAGMVGIPVVWLPFPRPEHKRRYIANLKDLLIEFLKEERPKKPQIIKVIRRSPEQRLVREAIRKLILSIELVPKTSFYANLRNFIQRKDWEALRRVTYLNYQQKCGICGAKGRLECHEIWEFDDENFIQTLKGFIPLCHLCHRVKHIGLTSVHSAEGRIEYEEVVKHFLRINNCSPEVFEEHKKEAFELWKWRSQHKYKISFGIYKNLIK